jgi:3-hydroxyacyl-CoA dehydrogenase
MEASRMGMAELLTPTALFVLSCASLFNTALNTLPMMMQVRRAQGKEPNAISGGVMHFCEAVANNWYIIMALGIILVVVSYSTVRTTQGRYWLDAYILKIPIFGRYVSYKVYTSMLLYFPHLIAAGVKPKQMIPIMEALADNVVLRRRIDAFNQVITTGGKMSEAMEKAGHVVADWVKEMLAAGIKSFYKLEQGKRYCYDPATRSYQALPGGDAYLMPSHRSEQTVWKNNSCRLVDLGDSVLGLHWNTKMGSIGGDVLSGIQTAVDKAEQGGKALVIANEGLNFSVGANVGMIFMLAIEQEYDELDLAIRFFQNTMMRVRYSATPVIVAPHGMTLGGACELNLHADGCCPAAETYTGLVELGVGVIPGGGGTKEFVLRASDEMHPDEPETITLKNRFLSIATAKVATSAHEGFNLGIYRKGQDRIVMNQNRRVSEAKSLALYQLEQGYVAPTPRSDIRVLGRSALGALYAGIHGMRTAGYATEHDSVVAKKLAYVMCGGDLSEPTLVSEQYLLDLEREAFLSLCGEKKTLERIQSVLKGGKPVRN